MSYVRIWVHIVFTTKKHEPILGTEVKQLLIGHIRDNCREKNILLDRVNGWTDHLHLLISLGREQNISKVVMLVKGESAHWLNQQDIVHGRFSWQDDYFAISVSESQVDRVRKYIDGQEDHHRAKSLDDELLTWKKIFDQ